jgi:hypothetical protein
MKLTIRVAIFRPGAEVTFEDLRNELEPMQKLVGGYVEFVHLSPLLGLICNEEGKLMDLPVNRYLATIHGIVDDVRGTFFVTRSRQGNFIGIKPQDEAILSAWKAGEEWVIT